VKANTKTDAVDSGLEYELVHMRGITDNKEPIKCESLDYQVDNCYRLIRTVEMYQTKETKHEERNDDNEVVNVRYTYDDIWTTEAITSGNFHDASKQSNNPVNAWPFKSEVKDAPNVNLGAYHLSEAQLQRIGSVKTVEKWADSELDKAGKLLAKTHEAMKTNGFVDFKPFEEYMYSTCKLEEATNSSHLGALRMKLEYAPCGQVSLVGQLI